MGRGRHFKSLTGLGLGFLVGAGVGATIGYVADVDGNDVSPVQAALFAAAPCAVVGALIGLGIAKRERWQEIPITVGGIAGAQSFGYAVRVTVPLGSQSRRSPP